MMANPRQLENGRWQYRWVDAAGRKGCESKDTKEAATKGLRARRHEADLGVVGIVESGKTFDEMANEYMLKYYGKGNRENTNTRTEYALLQLRRVFGSMRLDGIRERDIDEYADGRVKKGIAGRTRKMELSLLKNIFDLAVHRHYLATSPMHEYTLPSDKPVKERREWMPDEVTRFLGQENEESCGTQENADSWRTFWLCLFNLPVRKSEIVLLRWSQVYRKEGRLRLGPDDTKIDEGDWIELPDVVLSALQRQRLLVPADVTWVFPNKYARPRKNNLGARFWRNVLRARINPEGLDIHSMKVSHSTRLVREYGDPKLVQHVTRHRSIGVLLNIYNKVKPVEAVGIGRAFSYGHTMDTKKKGLSQDAVG